MMNKIWDCILVLLAASFIVRAGMSKLREKGERMIGYQWINNQLFIRITNYGQLDGYTLYEDTNTVGGVNFIRTFGG